MDRLAIIQEAKIVQPTVRFSDFKKRLKLWIDWLQYKSIKSLKEWLEFPFQEKIETMDRLAIIREKKIVETTVRFSI